MIKSFQKGVDMGFDLGYLIRPPERKPKGP